MTSRPDERGSPLAPPEGVCPSCHRTTLRFLAEYTAPIHTSKLLRSREDALAYPRRPVKLEICTACGLITNTSFDAVAHDYSASFEETQAFSPRFRTYASELARTLTARHALESRPVLEIGSGQADFLELLVAETGAAGIGVDPSWPLEAATSLGAQIDIERAFFQGRHVDREFGLVVSRHTLEHIADVRGFLELLREALRPWPRTPVVFEVPDTTRILREAAFWDVYYEHCSYFTPGSLARAFRAAGFGPSELELTFDDQYIVLTSFPREADGATLPLEEGVEALLELADAFAARIETIRQVWQARLAEATKRGTPTVVWGGGSKAVGFLAFLEVSDQVACVVDVNPTKHGMHLPGSGHEIVAPERLVDVRPGLVIVMNPAYADEIRADLARLGVGAEVDVL